MAGCPSDRTGTGVRVGQLRWCRSVSSCQLLRLWQSVKERFCQLAGDGEYGSVGALQARLLILLYPENEVYDSRERLAAYISTVVITYRKTENPTSPQ